MTEDMFEETVEPYPYTQDMTACGQAVLVQLMEGKMTPGELFMRVDGKRFPEFMNNVLRSLHSEDLITYRKIDGEVKLTMLGWLAAIRSVRDLMSVPN